MRYIILLLCLAACSSKKPSHFSGIAHTHAYHIHVGHRLNSKSTQEIEALIDDTFDRVNRLYNHWNPDSLLSTDSTAPELKPILSLAHSLHTLSEGRYDPTLGASIHLFKTEKVLPQKVYDLDGMLKGFVVDELIDKLTEMGYTDFYVEWGGEIAARGHHPSGRPWQVLVNKEVVSLTEGAFATSGAEEQMWDIEGAIYTHIMNPKTHRMLTIEEGKVSFVTVKAPSCALADALATACMACETPSESAAFAERMKEKHPVEFWIGQWQSQP